MAKTAELPEVFRWWNNPNPPDPVLSLLLILEEAESRQQVLGHVAQLNLAIAKAQVEFWSGVTRSVGLQASKGQK